MIDLAYLVASCLFILGLKMLSSPKTAPRGNLLAALGMAVAVVATLFNQEILSVGWILAGALVGGIVGSYLALTVKMTAMPQMVAIFNGFGGAASAVVAWSEYTNFTGDAAPTLVANISVPMVLSTLIGGITFTGSVIAFAKLQELIGGKPLIYPFQKTANLVLLLVAVVMCILVVASPPAQGAFYVLLLVSLVLGVLSVVPIGGADMPVVISLLNSYSGLAACSTGFVLKNNALIIGGSLVGASGIILTQIMCKAMNRSLANVLFSGFGAQPEEAASDTSGPAATGTVKQGTPDDAAMILEAANLVIFVPGYGMAVAQAQHVVRELSDLLEAHGVETRFAIHPVAGRMPGHMNVLLAEADVSYDKLYDMDQINPSFSEADVAMVIGANDVTNPAARHDRTSPIYGMPILDCDKARTVMVLKRSMRPGFAGVDNELYTEDRTMMVFGDAKDTITKIVQAVKEL